MAVDKAYGDDEAIAACRSVLIERVTTLLDALGVPSENV